MCTSQGRGGGFRIGNRGTFLIQMVAFLEMLVEFLNGPYGFTRGRFAELITWMHKVKLKSCSFKLKKVDNMAKKNPPPPPSRDPRVPLVHPFIETFCRMFNPPPPPPPPPPPTIDLSIDLSNEPSTSALVPWCPGTSDALVAHARTARHTPTTPIKRRRGTGITMDSDNDTDNDSDHDSDRDDHFQLMGQLKQLEKLHEEVNNIEHK